MSLFTDSVALLLLRIGPLAAAGYVVAIAVYRLYFHPLANVPGPKLAAVSRLYEFWWNCPMTGRYFIRVEELHDEYGPIVRINPNEVHIRDSDYYDVLYSNNQRIEKDAWFYNMWTAGSAAFNTIPSDTHRLRRSALSKSFSSAAIDRIEPRMQEKVKKLFRRLEAARESKKTLDLLSVFKALAMDIVSDYILPHSRDYLDEPDFGYRMHRSHRAASTIVNWSRHVKFLVPLIRRMPNWATPVIDPSAVDDDTVLDHYNRIATEAEAVMKTTRTADDEDRCVLETVRTSPLLPESERTYGRIISEAFNLLGAGVDSSATAMTRFVFHALDRQQPHVREKLRTELVRLHTPAPDANGSAAAADGGDVELVPSRTLDKLPYLQAAIKEALRLQPAVVSRLPRVNPTAPMTYTARTSSRQPNGSSSGAEKTYTFPPGTILSMNLTDMHFDPAIFPEPTSFRPERWLDASPEQRARMEKAWVPFSKGARNCLGHELARRELTLTMGNLFRTFGDRLELVDSSERDLSLAHDFFGPLPPRDATGVKVRIT